MNINQYLFYFFFLNLFTLGCKEKTPIPATEKYDLIEDIQKVTVINPSINESSGIDFFNNQIWTHNDGGNAPFLYQIDSLSDDILHQPFLSQIENNDWEDMTVDSHFVYIADIGNNRGNRKDLKLYKVPKNELPQDTIFNIETIDFSYEDQTFFLFEKEMHDYNAEAIINAKDSLFIFTKNHISQTTRCYNIPKENGIYSLSTTQEFPVEGLITAADYHEEKGVLILLGYQENWETYQPFIYCFWDFHFPNFFSGKNKRYNLQLSEQTEGIAFMDEGILLISSEKEMLIGGNLWQLDINGLEVGF